MLRPVRTNSVVDVRVHFHRGPAHQPQPMAPPLQTDDRTMGELCRKSVTKLQSQLPLFRQHQRPLQRQPLPLLSEGSLARTDGETTDRRQHNRPDANRRVQYQLDLDRVCSSRRLLDLRGTTGSRATRARVSRFVGCTDQMIRRRRRPQRIQGDRESGMNARTMTATLAEASSSRHQNGPQPRGRMGWPRLSVRTLEPI